MVKNWSSDKENQPDTYNLGAHNTDMAAEEKSSDKEEAAVIEVPLMYLQT